MSATLDPGQNIGTHSPGAELARWEIEDAEYLDIFAPGRQDFSWYKQKFQK